MKYISWICKYYVNKIAVSFCNRSVVDRNNSALLAVLESKLGSGTKLNEFVLFLERYLKFLALAILGWNSLFYSAANFEL